MSNQNDINLMSFTVSKKSFLYPWLKSQNTVKFMPMHFIQFVAHNSPWSTDKSK